MKAQERLVDKRANFSGPPKRLPPPDPGTPLAKWHHTWKYGSGPNWNRSNKRWS